MSKPAKGPAPALEDFPFLARDTVRFGDTDSLGHVNNAVFSTFLETGRAMLLLGTDAFKAPDGTGYALVHLTFDYRAEIHWPGEVVIGTRIRAVGGASITLEQAVFQDGKCAGSGDTVLVLFDLTARRALRLPDRLRAELEAACRP